MDARLQKLASNLVNYSTRVQKGEHVQIDCVGDAPRALVKELVKEIYKAGGIPYVNFTNQTLLRELLLGATPEMLDNMVAVELQKLKQVTAFIGIRGSENVNELADVPEDKMTLYMQKWRDVTNYRVNNTKWVVLRYPNYAMAQLANTSLEAFEDFYFDVCTLDYNKMSTAMDKLVDYMQKTDQVHIVGPGTDLKFSIKGIPAIKCAGELNIPDGEVFTAPVLDSVNGTLSYNCPAVYNGFTYENIVLTFENGKIVNATANDTAKINTIFDADAGARFVGEFAIGVNPYILKPMKDTLFDEKIMGSFHFTPGQAYEDADNTNRSSVHWDLVCIQTPEYGGGEMYFDGKLIRKDGMFVVPELECLNPDALK